MPLDIRKAVEPLKTSHLDDFKLAYEQLTSEQYLNRLKYKSKRAQ